MLVPWGVVAMLFLTPEADKTFVVVVAIPWPYKQLYQNSSQFIILHYLKRMNIKR